MLLKSSRSVLRALWLLALLSCFACEPKVTIPVAAQDLAEGTILDRTMVTRLQLARSSATNSWAGALEPLFGKQLRISLRKGDPILSAYFEDRRLSSIVRKRGRGLSLHVYGAQEVRADDHVDLLGVVSNPKTNEGQVVVLAQDVAILTIGESAPAAQRRGESQRRATLLLTPQEGEIALLAAHNGEVHVALRRPGELDMQEETRFAAEILFSGESVRAYEPRRIRIAREPKKIDPEQERIRERLAPSFLPIPARDDEPVIRIEHFPDLPAPAPSGDSSPRNALGSQHH